MNLKKLTLYNCTFLYGAKNKFIDVTIIMKQIILSTNNIKITNNLFKQDPIPNIIKHLKILNNNKKNIEIKENDMIKLEYDDMEMIDCQKISTISNELNNYNKVIIFGKGPTFKNIPRDNEKTLHIGINQASNILDDIDMIVINDIHNIFKITPETIKKLKYILTPEYMNIELRYNENGYWKNAYIYLINNGFTGKYIIYNLKNRKVHNNNIITFESYHTSANSAIEFICKYTKITDIQTYGVANGFNYGEGFNGNGIYDEKRIEFIRNNITYLQNKYNRNIIIN